MKSPIVQRLRDDLHRRIIDLDHGYGALVDAHLQDGGVLLDVGCGAHIIAPFERSRCPNLRVWGLDPDPAARSNPHLDQFFPLTGGEPWPIPDDSVDIAVSSAVLEHVEDPAAFMKELARVLKPGGRFVFYTPNKHYPLIVLARVLPHDFKERLLVRTRQRAADDVFPAFYRMNTKSSLTAEARAAALEVEYLRVREFEPSGYLDFCLAGYLASCAAWGLSRATTLSRWFGPVLMGVLKKPAAMEQDATTTQRDHCGDRQSKASA